MRLREQLTIEKLHPAGKQTIDKMLEKGWIERGSDAGGRAVYCITTIGQEALRAYIPG
jgi:DNA-binding PadR family transcriptional regulator